MCLRLLAKSSNWMSARRQDSAKKVLKESSRAIGAKVEHSLTATIGSQTWCFLDYEVCIMLAVKWSLSFIDTVSYCRMTGSVGIVDTLFSVLFLERGLSHAYT